MLNILKAFCNAKVLFINISMLLYIGLEIWLFSKVGLWRATLIKDTIFWGMGTAFAQMLSLPEASEEEGYFRRALQDNIRLVLIYEFVVNFYTFGFSVEMVLIPFLVVIVTMGAMAESRETNIKGIINSLLILSNIIILFHVIRAVLESPLDIVATDNLRAFVLPIVFSAAYMPFLYFWGIIMCYEEIFVRINIMIGQRDPSLAKRVKWHTFMLCGVKMEKLHRFMKAYSRSLGRIRSEDEMLLIFQDFRDRT